MKEEEKKETWSKWNLATVVISAVVIASAVGFLFGLSIARQDANYNFEHLGLQACNLSASNVLDHQVPCMSGTELYLESSDNGNNILAYNINDSTRGH